MQAARTRTMRSARTLRSMRTTRTMKSLGREASAQSLDSHVGALVTAATLELGRQPTMEEEHPDAFEEFATRFAELGFREFTAIWPPESAMPLLERIGTHLIPSLRR